MTKQYGEERRRLPRIYVPFPATVQGINRSGEPFQASTMLDNLSAGGLYLRIPEQVEKNAKISIATRLSVRTDGKPKGAHVEFSGVVLRVESLSGGVCGIAVKFKNHRFL